MTSDEWEAVALLLENGWRGQFDDDSQAAYRVLLDGYSAEDVTGALRVLMHTSKRGQVPTAAEIVQAITTDPFVPSLEEVSAAVYGPGGVLRARASGRAVWVGDEREEATRAAQLERAGTFGPYIERFVRHVGVGWLERQRPEGEYAFQRKRDLREEWERFLELARARGVYQVAMAHRRGELGRVDPLAAIGMGEQKA